MKAVCPICENSIDTNDEDVLYVEIARSVDLENENYPTQNFYCHFDCMQKILKIRLSVDLFDDKVGN